MGSSHSRDVIDRRYVVYLIDGYVFLPCCLQVLGGQQRSLTTQYGVATPNDTTGLPFSGSWSMHLQQCVAHHPGMYLSSQGDKGESPSQ